MYISIKYVPSLVFAIVSSAVVTTGGVSEVTFGDCLACNISCLFLKESTYVNVYRYMYIYTRLNNIICDQILENLPSTHKRHLK